MEQPWWSPTKGHQRTAEVTHDIGIQETPRLAMVVPWRWKSPSINKLMITPSCGEVFGGISKKPSSHILRQLIFISGNPQLVLTAAETAENLLSIHRRSRLELKPEPQAVHGCRGMRAAFTSAGQRAGKFAELRITKIMENTGTVFSKKTWWKHHWSNTISPYSARYQAASIRHRLWVSSGPKRTPNGCSHSHDQLRTPPSVGMFT